MAGVLFGLDRADGVGSSYRVEEVKGLEEVREAGRISGAGQWPQFRVCRASSKAINRRGARWMCGDRRFPETLALKARKHPRPAWPLLTQYEPLADQEARLPDGARRVPRASTRRGPAQVEWRRFRGLTAHRPQEARAAPMRKVFACRPSTSLHMVLRELLAKIAAASQRHQREGLFRPVPPWSSS